MRNTKVGILTALLVTLSTGLAEARVAGENHPSQSSLCSRVPTSQSWGTEPPEQEWSSLSPAAKVAVQEANCPSVDVVALTGDALIDHLRTTSTECYKHFRFLYKFTGDYGYDLSTIFNDQNMQSAFKTIERLAPAYDGTNSTGMLQLWTFVRDGYFLHAANPDRIGGPLNEATHRAHLAASEAFAASDHFLSLNDFDAVETLDSYFLAADREGARQYHVEQIKLVLLEIASKGTTSDSKREVVLDAVLLLLNRGLARKDQGFIDTLSRDPEIVDALLQATRYDFVYEHEFIPVEVLGALGRLSQLASLEKAVIAALTSVVMERERFSNSFLIAAELLEDRVDCMSLNVCRDTLTRELHTQLFPNTYSFDNGTLVFETPLSPEVVQSLYRAAKEVEAQFYRLLETSEPVRDDKEVLHVKIYGSKSEYWQFHTYLFGVDARTAAGTYRSDNITVYTYYARDSPTLEEVFRHEYVHYLADFFIPMGLDDDCLLTWFHEGLAEFLMGSTQARGISVLRFRVESLIRQEAAGVQRHDPAQIFGSCYSSIGFNDDLYNYSSLFFHFMYQQRRTQLLDLIDLVRSGDTSSSLGLIDTWAKDPQLATDYSAFVDEQVANVDQLPYHPEYSIFLPDDFDSQISPPRDTALLLPASLQSDNSTEIERALQQINGDMGLACRTIATEPNPRFECTGSLPAGSEFSGGQGELSSGDQGESSLFSLFDSFTDQSTQSGRDRGPLNEHLNARLDSFIVAAVEDGAINNFEDMTCYFTNVAGSPPIADLSCEGPLRPMDLAQAQVDLKTALCCASDIGVGANVNATRVSRLYACGIESCASESGVTGEPLYLWTTLGFSAEAASNVTMTWAASLPVQLEVLVPRWLTNQCEIVEMTEQGGTLACGPVYDERANHPLDFAPFSSRRHAASEIDLHLELALHVTPLQAGLLDFSVEFSADEEEIDPSNNIQWLRGIQIGLPNSSQLTQNAPNPFNSQTVLSYFLHAPGPARLEVFALTGQRVAVLHQGPQQAGYHRLRWNGRDDAGHPVASGMYLYRLVTDESVLTRKLMLLR